MPASFLSLAACVETIHFQIEAMTQRIDIKIAGTKLGGSTNVELDLALAIIASAAKIVQTKNAPAISPNRDISMWM